MADKREDRDPLADDGISDDEFDRLIEQSSLGTPGARRLRNRATPGQVAAVWKRVDAAGGEDSPVQYPENSVSDELVGYRGPSACQIAGITYRQLDYWARTSLVVPSIRSTAGSGSQRLYSFTDLVILKIVKRLLDSRISLPNIRVAVDHLRQRGVRGLASTTLFSDGTTVYECESAEEAVNLLQDGQGIFGVPVAGVMHEVTNAIMDFSGERGAEVMRNGASGHGPQPSQSKGIDRRIG